MDETAFSDFENKEFIEKIKKLNIELIVVSPLKRAFETAKIIKNYLDSTVELITDERFKEQMFGEFS
ncbi:MAG: histidine phosphatase family protein [Patescibacteria group bacterium]